MKSKTACFRPATLLFTCAVAVALAGCASTGEQPKDTASTADASAPRQTSKFKTPDGRTIDIGKASASNAGRNFKDPHLEKCWIADGFDFNGYETLYLPPTSSTAKFQPDEELPHQIAKAGLASEIAVMLIPKKLFANIVTNAAEIKPGAKTLRLENTVIEYSKGGGAARYFVGLYGGGQPALRVQGVMTDGDKTVFTYQARRSGVSGGARMAGAAMKDVDIQKEDIHSLALDLTDFMSAIAGQYTPLK